MADTEQAAATDASPPTDTKATPKGAAKAAAAPAPVCPTCGGALVIYAGEALHKVGSAWCAVCGVRHHTQPDGTHWAGSTPGPDAIGGSRND